MFAKIMVRILLVITMVLGTGSVSAFAEEFPSKPITLIIPFGPGGSHDLNARVFTSIIPTYLGQPMVVKLMPGASGQKGTSAGAKARPDGYTLLFTHNYLDQLQQHVTKLPYDTTKDFRTVARLNFGQASVVVRADKPWKSLKEMMDYGKKNPGKLKFGHSGQWGALMVPGSRLLMGAGVKATFVPFKGGGPVMKALLAGNVDFTLAFASVVSSQGDKVRVLASAGEERMFKGVPTYKELGYNSNIGSMTRIVMAPAKTPQARIDALWKAFEGLKKDKTFVKMMKRLDENTNLMSGADYDKERLVQKKQYAGLVKELTGK